MASPFTWFRLQIQRQKAPFRVAHLVIRPKNNKSPKHSRGDSTGQSVAIWTASCQHVRLYWTKNRFRVSPVLHSRRRLWLRRESRTKVCGHRRTSLAVAQVVDKKWFGVLCEQFNYFPSGRPDLWHPRRRDAEVHRPNSQNEQTSASAEQPQDKETKVNFEWREFQWQEKTKNKCNLWFLGHWKHFYVISSLGATMRRETVLWNERDL